MLLNFVIKNIKFKNEPKLSFPGEPALPGRGVPGRWVEPALAGRWVVVPGL